jgi:hypothetical protein
MGILNCSYCDLDTKIARESCFILNDNVWNFAGLNRKDIACIDCIESRIKRRLDFFDFNWKIFLNVQIEWKEGRRFVRGDKLLNRMFSVNPENVALFPIRISFIKEAKYLFGVWSRTGQFMNIYSPLDLVKIPKEKKFIYEAIT